STRDWSSDVCSSDLPDTPLEPGSRVLACSQGLWRRARVIALENDDRVRLNYVGWDPSWEESHRRSQLQLDADLPPPAEKPPETSIGRASSRGRAEPH